MRNRLLILAFAAACLPATTFASDSAGWNGSGEFGLAAATGNVDNQTLNARLALNHDSGGWKHAFGASFLYGKSDGTESAWRYELFGTTGRRLGDRSYVFGSLRTERDHFAGNEYRWSGSGGYGYEALSGERTRLTFEIGPGYTLSKRQGRQDTDNRGIVRGHTDFKHAFNPNTSVYDVLLVEAGADNTFARNDFGLQVKMSAAMSLKAGFEMRHNSVVPEGVKNTDTLTTLNMVYGF